MPQPIEYESARVRGMIFAFTLLTGALRAVTAVLGFALRVLPGPDRKAQ